MIQSVEGDLFGRTGNTGQLKHVFEGNTFPFGIAHRAMAQLTSVYARFKETAAVTGTLMYCGDFFVGQFL